MVLLYCTGGRALQKNLPNVEEYLKISEWLKLYHSTNDIKKQSELKTLVVSVMMPVVKHIAKTIARRADDPIEDLVQAGSIGLLKAIDNFSKEKNDNFRVYAGYLIIGEMKHYLRDKLSLIRVPRHIQELSIRINNFTQSLTPDEVQALTSEDVASALELPTKTVDYALEMDRRRSTLSLDDMFQADSEGLNYEEIFEKGDYKEQAEIEDLKIIFNDFIDKLPPELKIIIDMYYKQDMSQREIADALQLSQMSVSRKMKHAFNQIYQLVVDKENERTQHTGDN
jgi:RNA polymerase sigma-B factor